MKGWGAGEGNVMPCAAHLGGKCCHYLEGHEGPHRIIATGEQCNDPNAIETAHPWIRGLVKWIDFEKGDDDDCDESDERNASE